MGDVDFPRGGSSVRKTNVSNEKDLFQADDSSTLPDDIGHNKQSKATPAERNTSAVTPGTKRKCSDENGKINRDRQKAKQAKKQLTKADVKLIKSKSKPNLMTITKLNYEVIEQDMMLLGCISCVLDYSLEVCLPFGLHASVPLTELGDSYTAQLSRMADGADDGEEVSSLSQMYRVGQVVKLKVAEMTSAGANAKRISATMNPRLLNSQFSKTDLKSGMMLPCCISSVEDHGYVIDFGIDGVNAFITNKKASSYIEDYNEGNKLCVGTVLTCSVRGKDNMAFMSGELRTIEITIEPRLVYKSVVTEQHKLTLSSLQPGMFVEATVVSRGDNGINVKALGFKGYVPELHMKPSSEEQFKAAILYINPDTKALVLSQLPHLVSPHLAPRRPFHDLCVGDLVEDFTVVRVQKSRGIHAKLSQGRVKAFAPSKYLPDKSFVDSAIVNSKYKCVVKKLLFCDNYLLVSLKKSHIEDKIRNYGDCNPGDVVDCRVLETMADGMKVMVGESNVKGLVPTILMSDIKSLKNPGAMFPKGKQLKCRVLHCVPNKSKLILTAKRSMVSSKVESITSFDQCKANSIIEGYISFITKEGVLVVFYNNVKGWVPRLELSTEEIEFPSKVFFVGQVVKCRVIKVNFETSRMKLSLKLKGIKKSFGTKEIEKPEDYKVGNTTTCIVKQVNPEGIDVTIHDTFPAFLPTNHLSDYASLCPLLAKSLKKGDIIPRVMYMSDKTIIKVTCKSSMIDYYSEDDCPRDFNQLQIGTNLVGYVIKIVSYGVFIDFLNGMVGLSPIKYLNKDMLIPEKFFYEGQTLSASVVNVDADKKRFLVSLKDAPAQDGFSLLTSYLDQSTACSDTLYKLAGSRGLLRNRPGDEVTVSVTQSSTSGVVGEVEVKQSKGEPTTVKAFVIQSHMERAVEVGETLTAVIVDVDLTANCYQLSLQSRLTTPKTPHKPAKVGDKVKSEIVFIQKDCILVSLDGIKGLAYLPVRKNFNDVTETANYSIGQRNRVVVKKIHKKQVIVGLAIDELKFGGSSTSTNNASQDVNHPEAANDINKNCGEADEEEEEDIMLNIDVSLGSIHKAVIKKINESHLTVHIGVKKNHYIGTVHITEICDHIPIGKKERFIHSFKIGKKINVKVIGTSGEKGCVLLCSMKPSVMASKTVQPHKVYKDFRVPVFISNIDHKYMHAHLTPEVRGRLAYISNSVTPYCVGDAFMATVKNMLLPDVAELYFQDDQPCTSKQHKIPASCQLLVSESEIKVTVATAYNGDYLVVNSGDTKTTTDGKLNNSKTALLFSTDASDDYSSSRLSTFKVGDAISAMVVNAKKHFVSTRKSLLSKSKDKKLKVVDIDLTSKPLHQGQICRGFVYSSSSTNLFVRLSRSLIGSVNKRYLSRYSISNISKYYPKGTLVTVFVVCVNKSECCLSMLSQDTKLAEQITPQQISELTPYHDSPTTTTTTPATTIAKQPSSVPETSCQKRKRKAEERNDKAESLSKDSPVKQKILKADFSWGEDKNSGTKISSKSSDNETDDDSDEEDDDVVMEEKKKKLSRKEKHKRAAKEEDELFMLEQKNQKEDSSTETKESFEKMLLESPDSSVVWLKYIAWTMHTSGVVDEARAIANRALSTINFREDQEKQNIWVAKLNLENLYGTDESLQAVLSAALQQCDQLFIYKQLISIYAQSHRNQEAENVYLTIVKRFAADKSVWKDFGKFYAETQEIEKCRKLMLRALKSLDTSNHVDTIVTFARLEFKHGDVERGCTVFDSVLANYPKRSDVWSVYTDCMVKYANPENNIQKIRDLFERILDLNFSAKKVKFFFRKFAEFENKFGSETSIEEVKMKALQFVQQNKN